MKNKTEPSVVLDERLLIALHLLICLWTKRPQYYKFVFFQFWQGPRPSESIALRRSDVDLRYATAGIHKSIVQGREGGTKTVRSNREIHLHDNVVKVLSQENPEPLSVDPEDYLFTTPAGTPIDVGNFYKREWLPILKAKKIRPRPFYNTRHTRKLFIFDWSEVGVHLQPDGRQHQNAGS